MALPSRLKSALRPVIRATKLTGPTTVGVLISVGAHVLLLAFGPRTAFSFKALTQAAQAADAQETIVPLVQLSPAEQNRLPNFAQPQLPSNLNGLSSLSLPPGLPLVPNTKIPTAQSRPLTGSQFTSRPLPGSSITSDQLRQLEAGRLSQGFKIGTTFPGLSPGGRTSSALGLGNRQSVEIPVSPPMPPASIAPTAPANASPTPLANGSGPAAPSAIDLLPQFEPNQNTISFGDAVARANDQPNAGANPPDIGDRIPASGSPNAAQTPAGNSDDNSSAIARVPAQGNFSQLAQDFVYNSADVSEDAAQKNAAEWLQTTAEGKGENIAQASADLGIDSGFIKVCQENPPVNALIGVVVNPDGTQTDLTLLKRTGYPILDRQAINAVSYADLDTAAVPTQYQVNINVDYSPQGCVENLPDADN
ncbi:MAG: hypothetical protein DCF15_09950 [Phormidesmis priestleyi]|uniref:TonB C-terminal domain-containing protein n=1 Tax=Phormidesmis priestleyi TaxID=268141 RepID=A0A2W4XER3_9CYAN|nr:MAG: hypothetical protein DCF15_09950 [Phormidesmis priestleyi]